MRLVDDATVDKVKHIFDEAWLWSTSFHFFPAVHRHKFTPQELQSRLVAVGLTSGACLLSLTLLALYSITTRRYGSFSHGYSAFLSKFRASKREFCNTCQPNGGYNLLQKTEHVEEDPEMQWGTLVAEVSDHNRAQDAAKFQEKLAKLRETYGAELPEHLDEEQLQKQAPSPETQEVERTVSKLKERPPVPKMSPEQKAELMKLQIEEYKKDHGQTNVSCLHIVKKPISIIFFLLYAFTCIGIPLSTAQSAICTQGFPWEVHIPFFGLFYAIKLWELFLLTYDDTIPGQLDVLPFFVKFLSSFLGFIDGYSDAVSMVIAHSCGSNLWYWMFFFYFFGVVIAQWTLMAVLSLTLDSSGTCFFKMMHMDALSMCCSMDPTDKKAIWMWRLINIFRTIFEDLPQSVLQIMFLVTVKSNYVMIVSVLVGAASSCLAVASAIRRAAEAAGTNWERLEALSVINQALVDKDLETFAEAVNGAESNGFFGDEAELNAWWVKADAAFDLPCGKQYIKVLPESPEAMGDTLLKLQALPSGANAGKYSEACRSMKFAEEAAAERENFWKDAETKGSEALKRGAHHEGRHTRRIFESGRRTEQFAKQAQEEREKRICAMLVEASGN